MPDWLRYGINKMQDEDAKAAPSRFRSLPAAWLWPVRIGALALVLLAFNLHFFVGYTLLANRYIYTILLIVIPTIYILLP